MVTQMQTPSSNRIAIYWQLTIAAVIFVPQTPMSALVTFHSLLTAFAFLGKTTVSVLDDAQLLMNKQQ